MLSKSPPDSADPFSFNLDLVETPEGLSEILREERLARIAQITAPAISKEASPPGGITHARSFSDLADGVISRLFTISCTRSGANPASVPLCIVATGGYGRRELAPYSDIDITFVPNRDGDPRIDRVVREMFRGLMDIGMEKCGLEVGYAYRLLEDCASLDHQTSSGLLDARLIAGSERLFIQFEDAYWAGFNAVEFIFTKLDERRKALNRWGGTLYLVEPNLKEGAGGLRDLQTAIWLAQAKNHLPAARVRGNRAFSLLGEELNLTVELMEKLAQAKEKLQQTRNALHACAKEERDILVVTRQEEVAAALGYGNSVSSPPVERFMEELYTHLALIHRVSDQAMDQIENSRLILGIGLDCKKRAIVPANDSLALDDPSWLLWAFELAQRYSLLFSRKFEFAALELTNLSPPLPDHSTASQVFTRILSQTGKVYPIVQKMADMGALGWLLPEFMPLMNLIPYDPAHDYTVGQHTLYVVRNLETLLNEQGANDELLAEMRYILQDLTHPEQLMLAALLHDCGKAEPGRPHAETGAEDAVKAVRRLGWDSEAEENVSFLVRHHLLMAETSRLRDLDLEETIQEFIRIVDDPDKLNMLYLLTYADTTAVGNGVWTSVKGRFLRQLWQRSMELLLAGEEGADEPVVLARARKALLRDISLKNLPEEEVQEHIQAMPAGYLLNQSSMEIVDHISMVRRVRLGEIVVEFRDEPAATFTELTVCTFDAAKPGLLARIAGALNSSGLITHSAQVVTRITETDRIALDTLWVEYRGRQLSIGKKKEVARKLQSALSEENPRIPDIPANGHRITVHSIRNDLSSLHTLIEITAPDEQTALYGPACALAQLNWNIHSARVSTWQGETHSVFYVAKLRDLSEEEAKMRLIRALNYADSSV